METKGVCLAVVANGVKNFSRNVPGPQDAVSVGFPQDRAITSDPRWRWSSLLGQVVDAKGGAERGFSCSHFFQAHAKGENRKTRYQVR